MLLKPYGKFAPAVFIQYNDAILFKNCRAKRAHAFGPYYPKLPTADPGMYYFVWLSCKARRGKNFAFLVVHDRDLPASMVRSFVPRDRGTFYLSSSHNQVCESSCIFAIIQNPVDYLKIGQFGREAMG